MPHLNIAFDRYASIGTLMHYILVISKRELINLRYSPYHVARNFCD